MKEGKIIFLLTILAIILFTGCSSNTTQRTLRSSSMLRTVGVGENSMPIDGGSFTLELFNDEATSIDMITETHIVHTGENAPEDELTITGERVNDYCRYYGLNARYGIDNYTEGKIGVFIGSIKNGYKSQNDDPNLYTSLAGFRFGLKRLLTHYDSPNRLSIFAEGKYFTTSSEDYADKYDGSIIEFKSALIYGYLADPSKRNFPSVSLYYSLANTKRDETIIGVSRKHQPQAIGVESNYSVDMGPVYYMVFVGMEKEIADITNNEMNAFFGMKVGIHFNRKTP